MKSIYVFVGLCVGLAFPAWLAGQTAESGRYVLNHAEIGAYGDYFRFAPSGSKSTNFVGAGGRASFNVNPNVGIEAEMSYDFARNFSTPVTNGGSTTFVTSSVRPLTGLFGPRFQFGTSGPFRVFATGKVGFVDFSVNNSGTVSGSTFTGAVSGVGNPGTHFALYPGGGIEGFIGPVGIRADGGDEIYLNNGTHNNLRVAVGPTIRF